MPRTPPERESAGSSETFRQSLPVRMGSTGCELAQHDTKREDVIAGIWRRAVNLFRGHVGRRPADRGSDETEGAGRRARFGGRRLRAQRCQAKVENLDVPIAPYHHVLGLEIAMDDALSMCSGERYCNLVHYLERFPQGHRRAANSLAQRRPVDKFHGEKRNATRLADFIHSDDVRVIERCEYARSRSRIGSVDRCRGRAMGEET